MSSCISLHPRYSWKEREREEEVVIDILSTLSVAPLGLLGLELEKALACQGTNHPCDAFPLFSTHRSIVVIIISSTLLLPHLDTNLLLLITSSWLFKLGEPQFC